VQYLKHMSSTRIASECLSPKPKPVGLGNKLRAADVNAADLFLLQQVCYAIYGNGRPLLTRHEQVVVH